MSSLSDYDFGWLVGILEGEGCFYLDQRWAKGTGTPRVQVKMTDEDSMNRLALLLEQILEKEVRVKEASADLTKQSQPYEIVLNGDPARIIMRLVVRRMSWRRRQRIWQCLNSYKQPVSTETVADVLKLVRNG